MTRQNQLAARTAMARRQRVRGDDHRSGREARMRRTFDGVVASYIRELAATGEPTPRAGNLP